MNECVLHATPSRAAAPSLHITGNKPDALVRSCKCFLCIWSKKHLGLRVYMKYTYSVQACTLMLLGVSKGRCYGFVAPGWGAAEGAAEVRTPTSVLRYTAPLRSGQQTVFPLTSNAAIITSLILPPLPRNCRGIQS